eukprot:5923597-Prymnesium_polylepis.1
MRAGLPVGQACTDSPADGRAERDGEHETARDDLGIVLRIEAISATDAQQHRAAVDAGSVCGPAAKARGHHVAGPARDVWRALGLCRVEPTCSTSVGRWIVALGARGGEQAEYGFGRR